MLGLDDIIIARYSNQFKQLSVNLQQAADLLIPDAYEMEKEQLLKAKGLVEKNFQTFDEVLSRCSSMSLNESSIVPVENNINHSVRQVLWVCQDIVTSVMLFGADLSDYIIEMEELNRGPWQEQEQAFSGVLKDLDEVSGILTRLLEKFDV